MQNGETDTLTIGHAWGGRLCSAQIPEGTLDKQERIYVAAWRDSYLIQGTIITLLVAILLSIRKIVEVTPWLLGAFYRTKENFNLENILSVTISRDITALLSLVSASVLAARYRMIPFGFIANDDAALQLLCSFATLLAVWAYRKGINALFTALTGKDRVYKVLMKSSYTYFIIMTALAFIITGVMYVSGNRDWNIIRIGCASAAALTWITYIFREIRIFIQSNCSPYSSFLYLCTLEILPIGVTALMTMIF